MYVHMCSLDQECVYTNKSIIDNISTDYTIMHNAMCNVVHCMIGIVQFLQTVNQTTTITCDVHAVCPAV